MRRDANKSVDGFDNKEIITHDLAMPWDIRDENLAKIL